MLTFSKILRGTLQIKFFSWPQEREEVFIKLKEYISRPVLSQLIQEEELIIYLSALLEAISVVLVKRRRWDSKASLLREQSNELFINLVSADWAACPGTDHRCEEVESIVPIAYNECAYWPSFKTMPIEAWNLKKVNQMGHWARRVWYLVQTSTSDWSISTHRLCY